MGKGKEEMEKKKSKRKSIANIYKKIQQEISWNLYSKFLVLMALEVVVNNFFFFTFFLMDLVLCLSCCPYNFTCENWFFFSSGEDFLSFFVKLLICPTRWRAKKKVWLLLSTNQFYRIWTREREKKKSSQRVMGLVLYAQNNASCNQLPHRLNQQFKSNTNIWISFGCKGTKLCLFWFFFPFYPRSFSFLLSYKTWLIESDNTSITFIQFFFCSFSKATVP